MFRSLLQNHGDFPVRAFVPSNLETVKVVLRRERNLRRQSILLVSPQNSLSRRPLSLFRSSRTISVGKKRNASAATARARRRSRFKAPSAQRREQRVSTMMMMMMTSKKSRHDFFFLKETQKRGEFFLRRSPLRTLSSFLRVSAHFKRITHKYADALVSSTYRILLLFFSYFL